MPTKTGLSIPSGRAADTMEIGKVIARTGVMAFLAFGPAGAHPVSDDLSEISSRTHFSGRYRIAEQTFTASVARGCSQEDAPALIVTLPAKDLTLEFVGVTRVPVTLRVSGLRREGATPIVRAFVGKEASPRWLGGTVRLTMLVQQKRLKGNFRLDGGRLAGSFDAVWMERNVGCG